MRQADAATLRLLVDWPAVREGLKEDICDLVLDEPPTRRANNELAPFGSGFVRGITGHALDRSVTPESVVSMTHAVAAPSRAEARVAWAFFDNPTRFSVDVRTDRDMKPIRAVMELRGLRWRVNRIWLPDALLERANAGT